MTGWYHEAFGAHYLSLYSHRDEAEARETVDLIMDRVDLPAGGRVLDAPCGAGRHAREFAARGMGVIALDLSAHLLGAAASHPAGCRNPDYLLADLRHIPVAGKTFDLVVNLFSSFGYFKTDDENMSVLKELARVCRPGGCVVVDTMNPSHVRRYTQPYSERHTADGWLVREHRSIGGTPTRVEKRIEVVPCHGRTEEWIESVRLFEPEELLDGARGAGLNAAEIFGDYTGKPWTSDSPRFILMAERTS